MSVDERITILCAVRYAMGRKSYAPGAVRDYIRSRKNAMNEPQTLKLIDNIERDISEYNDMSDKAEWNNLIDFLKS